MHPMPTMAPARLTLAPHPTPFPPPVRHPHRLVWISGTPPDSIHRRTPAMWTTRLAAPSDGDNRPRLSPHPSVFCPDRSACRAPRLHEDGGWVKVSRFRSRRPPASGTVFTWRQRGAHRSSLSDRPGRRALFGGGHLRQTGSTDRLPSRYDGVCIDDAADVVVLFHSDGTRARHACRPTFPEADPGARPAAAHGGSRQRVFARRVRSAARTPRDVRGPARTMKDHGARSQPG